MNTVLIVASILLVLLGLVGALVPGIAGPPFSYFGLFVLSFVNGIDYSWGFLLTMGIIGAFVFAMDYWVPVWGTKKLGGSKAGVKGSMIGLVVGIVLTFMFPIGLFIAMLLGPFIGAYIGEKSVGTSDDKALKAAFGSFVGFLVGTGVKAIYAVVCIFFVIKDLIKLI